MEEIANIDENMHYDIPMSSEKKLPIEESSEISDTKKLTSINNNQPANNSVEKTNNGEDHFINIQKSLNLKTSNVLPFLISNVLPNACLSETALRNGCYTVTFLDLMFLEVCHTYAQMKDIKSYDKLFKPGWLHDEIINFFLFNLIKEDTEVLFCGSTEAMLIHHAKSFRKMWKNEDLMEKSLVLIPFNPTNSHWKLICINLSEVTVSVLDPMVKQCQDQDALDVAKTILQKKFGIHKFHVKKMQYLLPRDCISCGVFVCYFVEQIVKGKPMTHISTTAYRKRISDMVSGNSLLQRDICVPKDVCKICLDTNENTQKAWVQCCRCSRWFHCCCVSINLEDAKENDFFCS